MTTLRQLIPQGDSDNYIALGTQMDRELDPTLEASAKAFFASPLPEGGDGQQAICDRLASDNQYLGLIPLLLSEDHQKTFAARLYWNVTDPAEQDRYAKLFTALGTDVIRLPYLTEARKDKLFTVLRRLLLLQEIAGFRTQTLLYHAQELCALADPDGDLDQWLISEQNRYLNNQLAQASTLATRFYGIMSVLAIAGTAGAGIPTIAFSYLSQLWNYIDTNECYAEAWQQWAQQEMSMAWANIVGGTQMLFGTVFDSVYEVSSEVGQHLLPISAAVGSGVVAYTFALSYVFCFGIECQKVWQSNQEISGLQEKLVDIERNILIQPTDAKLQEQRADLATLLLIAEARRMDQKNSAQAFGVCMVAMIVVIVVAYVGLSAVTFGGVPAATLLVGAAVFATYLFRSHYTQNVSHSALAQATLHSAKTDSCVSATDGLRDTGKTSLHTRLMSFLHGQQSPVENAWKIDFRQKVTIQRYGFFSKTTTMRDYLLELQCKDPQKLEKIVDSLESQNQAAFVEALSQKRSGAGVKTEGQKIYQQLVECSGQPTQVNPLVGNSLSVDSVDSAKPCSI